jgi:hypothetical protein
MRMTEFTNPTPAGRSNGSIPAVSCPTTNIPHRALELRPPHGDVAAAPPTRVALPALPSAAATSSAGYPTNMKPQPEIELCEGAKI